VGKKPYEPARAIERAHADAEDFVGLLDRWLAEYEERSGEEGVVVACYDTELFGHWWFEGPAWLERVFTLLRGHPRVRPMSLARALEHLPPQREVEMAEGSWGFRKDLRSWIAPETDDLWRSLAETESETVRIARKFAEAGSGPARDPAPGRDAALAQLARELFLLQSSDWPFMVMRGKNAGYARERFWSHRDRWARLSEALLRRTPDDALARLADELHEIDNPFPNMRASELI
jgi:1,4-alpha-glucan branching enzyme